MILASGGAAAIAVFAVFVVLMVALAGFVIGFARRSGRVAAGKEKRRRQRPG